MAKRFNCLTIAAVCGVALASWAQAAQTWFYDQTSGFVAFPTPVSMDLDGKVTRPQSTYHPLGDIRRVRGVHSMVVDAGGLVYATCNNLNNNGNSGGITIFNPTAGTKVDVDLNALGYTGAVLKLVVAGDGKVYGVQNWLEMGNAYAVGTVSRILRFSSTGTVEVIKEYSPIVVDSSNKWVNKIGGLTVASDGNPYWWYAGTGQGLSDFYWKSHVLWRYNILADGGAGAVEEYPLAGTTNDGFSQSNRLLNFEYVGKGKGADSAVDFFAVIGALGSSNWGADSIAWTKNRMVATNGGSAPNWGRDWCNATAWDPATLTLWVGPTGQGYGGATAVQQGTCIMTRWTGTVGNPGLFTDGVDGIAGKQDFHANGNAPDASLVGQGGPYWINNLAVDPATSKCWMGFGGQIKNSAKPGDGDYLWYSTDPIISNRGKVGNVYSVAHTISKTDRQANGGAEITDDEGRPQDEHPTDSIHENQVVAVVFTTGIRNSVATGLAYVLTADCINGKYNLFEARILAPTTGACCQWNDQQGTFCTQETQGRCAFVGGVYHAGPCSEQDCTYQLCHTPVVDTDGDNDVDQDDFAIFQQCLTIGGGTAATEPPCSCLDVAGETGAGADGQINDADFAPFIACGSGPMVPVTPGCY